MERHDKVLDGALLKRADNVPHVVDDDPRGALHVGRVLAEVVAEQDQAARPQDLVMQTDHLVARDLFKKKEKCRKYENM